MPSECIQKILSNHSSEILFLEEIKIFCTRYRFRFLPAVQFKGPIPYEIFSETRKIEKEIGGELSGFQIAAPIESFNNSIPPKALAIFISLGNQEFFLLHKYGRVPGYRALTMYPVKNIVSLIKCSTFASLIFTLIVPIHFIIQNAISFESLLMIKSVLFITGIMVIFLLTLSILKVRGRDFSENIWNQVFDP